MPEGLIVVNMMICERILTEADGVISAIRMVDVFTVDIAPNIPREVQGLQLKVLTMGKVHAGDAIKREAVFQVIRPDGTSKEVTKVMIETPPSSRYPGAPKGFVVALDVGVDMSQMGVHYIALLIDREERCKIPFTLIERQNQQSANKENSEE